MAKFPIAVLIGLTLRCVGTLAQTGVFIDSRDSTVYQTIQIKDQIWMATNMTFSAPDTIGQCYNNSAEMCGKYGALYTWEVANKVCPAGWHLPGRGEYETLLRNLDADGAFLPSERGGFDSQFGGYAFYHYSRKLYQFHGLDRMSVLWTSTIDSENWVYRFVVKRKNKKMLLYKAGVKLPHGEKGQFDLVSVRCIKD